MKNTRVKFFRPARVYKSTRFSINLPHQAGTTFIGDSLPLFNMRPSHLILAVACLLTLAASSCKKETGTRTAIAAKDYWPLTTGRSVTYVVDSTVWDDFNCSKRRDTSWLRYTVADSFMDGEGRTTYAINVDVRDADSLPWTALRTFSATITQQRLEVTDAGLRFIKLIDPVAEGREWNGNAYINTAEQELQHFSNWNYHYEGIGAAFNTGFKNYDNTVSVPAVDEQQNNPDDSLLADAYAFRTLSKEVYAKNVGLVYREMTRWIYDPNVKKCRRGYAIVMRAVENN